MTQRRRGLPGAAGGWFIRHPYILPLAILAAGGVFRFYNLNWDDGHELHPDERWIFMVVSGANGNPPLSWPHSISQLFSTSQPNGSPLDPHFFAYGSLPFYLIAALSGAVSFLSQHVPLLSQWSQVDTYGGLPLLARGLSGVLDLGSTVVLYFIARRMYGYWTAVLAMALAAFTVLDIQLSHFYTVDTVLVPFVLLTVLAAVIIAQSNSRWAYLWGGVVFGAALATKTTALLLVVPLGAACVLNAWSSGSWPAAGTLRERLPAHYGAVAGRLNDNLRLLLLTYALAAFSFVAFEPYAVIDRAQLVKDISSQTIYLVTNNPPFEVPYTDQYAGTIPYLYQIKNMLFWSMGIPLAAAAFIGVLVALVRNVGFRLRRDEAVLLLWIIPYFLFVGRFFAKFNRYMLPIIPLMTVLGAALLIRLVMNSRGRYRPVAAGALGAVLALTFLYSVAYMNIYANTNTRVAASSWIYAHIPPHSTIALESAWDDGLPLPENNQTPDIYTTPSPNLNLYDPDTPSKAQHIAQVLAGSNYLVMTSERLVRSIPRRPDAYPMTIRYYDLLMQGKLGYRLIRVFQEHPQLGPIVVHDYPADESFHVYDHPIVRIFKRVAPVSAGEVASLLTPALTTTVAATPAPNAPDTRLMLTAAQWKADQSGPTVDQMFPPSGFSMKHPILVWLLVLELLGLMAFPFTFVLFSQLADRGFVIAKTIGLLAAGWLVWMLVSLRIAYFERGAIMAVLACFALAALAFAYRLRWELGVFFRDRWRQAVAGEAVFLAGFALFVLLRMWYPDLGHQFSPVSPGNIGDGRMGEKQMEMAFLNAIVRSRVFPPFDPFFAHGYINYYYYGFYLVGMLCKVTQIAPATGFNLAIATFFGLLVGNISSAVLGLTRRIVPAVIAAALVGVVGNLNGGWQVMRSLMAASPHHLSWPVAGGLVDLVTGAREVLAGHQTLPPIDFWESTRIVPPVGGPITEFPYFTYLFADLHPHLMAYPMTAAALALGVSLALGANDRIWQTVFSIGLGGLLVGAIAVTNPWDYPTYLIVIALGAIVGAYACRRQLGLRTLVRAGVWLAGLAAVSFVLYLPFKQSYQTVFATGIGLVRDVTPQMLENNNVPASQVRDALVTPLHIYLEHFGLFLFLIVSYLALLLFTDCGLGDRLRHFGTAARFVVYYHERLRVVRRAARLARKLGTAREPALDWPVAAGIGIVMAGLLVLQYFLLATLAALLGAAVLLLLRLGRRLPAAQVFLLAIVLIPISLSIGTQVFFVKDWLAGGSSFRMNTIFKFYNQSWVLYATCATVSLYYFVQREARPRRDGSAEDPGRVEAGDPAGGGANAVLTTAGIAAGGRDRNHLVGHGRLGPLLGWAWASGSGGSLDALAPPEPTGDALGDSTLPAPDVVAERVHRRPGAAFLPLLARLRPLSAFVDRRPLWSACLAILLVGSLIYTYGGTKSRETYRTTWLPENSVPFTLDGMAFMKVAYPGDYAGIQWLNGHVHGAQVVAEADNGYYDWRSRVSMFTGLPTIMNGIHEGEQRNGDEIAARSGAVDTLYGTPSAAAAWTVIRQYDVRYIFVGFSERQCARQPNKTQCYPRSGLRKFDRMVGHGLTVAFRRPGITIYQVTQT